MFCNNCGGTKLTIHTTVDLCGTCWIEWFVDQSETAKYMTAAEYVDFYGALAHTAYQFILEAYSPPAGT